VTYHMSFQLLVERGIQGAPDVSNDTADSRNSIHFLDIQDMYIQPSLFFSTLQILPVILRQFWGHRLKHDWYDYTKDRRSGGRRTVHTLLFGI
jgi:hypothetical protein